MWTWFRSEEHWGRKVEYHFSLREFLILVCTRITIVNGQTPYAYTRKNNKLTLFSRFALCVRRCMSTYGVRIIRRLRGV